MIFTLSVVSGGEELPQKKRKEIKKHQREYTLLGIFFIAPIELKNQKQILKSKSSILKWDGVTIVQMKKL